jgi:hypothetical protein
LFILLLGELYHPQTGPEAAQWERIALARVAAAEANAENLRQRVRYYEGVAADESWPPSVRALNARNAEELALKAKQEVDRSRSERAEAEFYHRLKLRPGTRYPGLMLLGLGVSLELITLRRGYRAKVLSDEKVVSLD